MLITYTENCVKLFYDYFKEKFDNDQRRTVKLFKTARYFSSSKVSELNPTSSDLNSLSAFPCFDSEAIEGMKSELPTWLLQKMYNHRLTPVNVGNTRVQIYQCRQERSEK